MRLIDSHAHLQADAFAADLPDVLARARVAGVERILVPGWDAGSSAAAVRLAGEWRSEWQLDAAVGAHPHDASLVTDADWAAIVALAAAPEVVAIGETGLDFDRMHSPREAQLANLRRHLRLALDSGKPAILHCRSAEGSCDAQDLLIAELRAAGFGGAAARAAFGDRPPAVLHSFSGPVSYGAAAIEMGLAIAFGGLVFRRGEEASADVAKLVPGERLLIETDAPYLAPPGVPRNTAPSATTAPAPSAATAPAATTAPATAPAAPAAPTAATAPAATAQATPLAGGAASTSDVTSTFRGRRNSPEWVRITAEWLAEQRGETPDTIGAGLVAAYDATFRRHSGG
jgi:TatD DNase family protein